MLLQVYPKGHQYYKYIFYDTDEKQYYNARSDMYFVPADDNFYYNLRPIELIDNPQGSDYFSVWDRSECIKEQVLAAIDTVNKSIKPNCVITGTDYEMAKHKLADEIVNICKSLCPTQIWNSQSDA